MTSTASRTGFDSFSSSAQTSDDSTPPSLPEPAPLGISHTFRTLCCSHCGHEISVPIYCGDRFCPTCSKPRRLRIRDRLNFLITHSQPQKLEGLSKLELTIKNTPTIEAGLRHLVASFKKLRNQKKWKSHVRGGAFVFEVTGAPGNWHTHLHILLINRYLPQADICNMWRKASGSYITWIRRVPKHHAISYLTKYLSKPCPDAANAKTVNHSLAHFRLFQPFGFWHALSAEFVKPKFPCPSCGNTSWLPLDFFHDHHFANYTISPDIGPPLHDRGDTPEDGYISYTPLSLAFYPPALELQL